MKKLLLFVILFLSLTFAYSGFSQNTNTFSFKRIMAAATPIPTNSYYYAGEIDITAYGIYGSDNHWGGGLRYNYWTSTIIGAGLDIHYYNQNLTYTSVSLTGRTVMGPMSFSLEAGSGTTLSNLGNVQAQAGFTLCYQFQQRNINLGFYAFKWNPRVFGEVQYITKSPGAKFFFGLQKSF